MGDMKRPTLDYASGASVSTQEQVQLRSLLLTTSGFALAHFVVEITIQYLAAFQFGWFGRNRSPGDLQEDLFINMIAEVLWLVPASFIVFFVQASALAFTNGRGRRGTSWALALLLGTGYCLSRWGLWGIYNALGRPLSEGTNFFSSLLIAALCGGLLALWRRRRVD